MLHRQFFKKSGRSPRPTNLSRMFFRNLQPFIAAKKLKVVHGDQKTWHEFRIRNRMSELVADNPFLIQKPWFKEKDGVGVKPI